MTKTSGAHKAGARDRGVERQKRDDKLRAEGRAEAAVQYAQEIREPCTQ